MMQSKSLVSSKMKMNLVFKESTTIFLVLYVDDILLIENDIPSLQFVKTWLGNCFLMKGLGEVTYVLGVKIYRDRSRRLLGLSQSTYIDSVKMV